MKKSDHLGFYIRTISNLIQREVEGQEAKKGDEALTGINRFIIRHLAHHRNEDIFQKDLEEVFSARRSTMSVVLNRMETKGLLTRTAVKQDARLKKITLTEKGERSYEEMESAIAALETKLMHGFSPEEKNTLLFMLKRVRQNLETEENS